MEIIIFEINSELSFGLSKSLGDNIIWKSVSDVDSLFISLKSYNYKKLFISSKAIKLLPSFLITHLLSEYSKLVVSIVADSNSLLQEIGFNENYQSEKSRLSTALCSLNDVFSSTEDPEIILSKTIELIGELFDADRLAVYKISIGTRQLKELATWYKDISFSASDEIPKTHNYENIPKTIRFVFDYPKPIESYTDFPHPILVEDNIADYIHGKLGIQSLLSYPFAFNEDGYHVLTLNHFSSLKRFSIAEQDFLNSVTSLLNIALVNIYSLEGLQNSVLFLKESDAYNRMLFEKTPIGLALCNLDGVFIDANTAFVDLLHVTKEEIINKVSYWDFRPNDENSLNKLKVSSLKNPGDFYKFERTYPDGNGNDIPLLVHCAIISKDDDRFIWIALEDLSRQKQDAIKLSETEQKHMFITESVDNMIVYYDINGKVEYANKAMLDFMGMTQEEAIGTNFTDFIHPDMRDAVKYRLKMATENHIEKTVLEVDVISSNSKISHIQVLSSIRTEKGKLCGYISTCIDITARVERERAKARLHQTEAITNKILAIANEDYSIELSLQKILETLIAVKIIETTDRGGIFLSNKKNKKLETVAGINIKDVNNNDLEYFYPCDCVCGTLVQEKGKIHFSKESDSSPFYRDINSNYFCCVPIIYQNNSLGILTLFLKEDFTPTEIEINFLIGISDIIASMIMRKRVELEVSSQNNLLQSILDNAPVGIWYLNNNNELVFANKVVTEITGLTKEELNDNSKVNTVLNGESIVPYTMYNPKTYNDNAPTSTLVASRLKDGRTLYNEVTKVHVLNSQNEVEGLIGIAFDITENISSRRQIELQSAALEAAANGIMITDIDRKIVWANPALCRSFGYSLSELQGKDSGLLIASELNENLYEETSHALHNGLPWHGEVLSQKKDGTVFDQELTITPLVNHEDKTTYFIAVHQDITERKAIYNGLIDAKKKAEEANEIKSNFLSNMSHELRTPLNGILGFAELLIERMNDEKHKYFAQNVYRSGKRLESTIEQIFELTSLSNITSNPVISRFNLNELCADITDHFREDAHAKNLMMDTIFQEFELTIDSDRLLIEKTLSKIVDNAIKYSDSGTITVSAGYTDFTRSHIFISVEDEGIGIPSDKFDIIFEEFRQVSEGKARSFEGVGLGLAVARKCISTLNGEILLHSIPDKGSCFTIQIPLSSTYNTFLRHHNKAISNEHGLSQSAITNIKKGKVLIVEDEEINQKYLEVLINELYEYTTTDNGVEAIQLSKEHHFDIIFMDINLGKQSIDGLTTAQEIRSIAGYEEIPIVAVTAFASESDKLEFLSKGCSHYLSKPYTKRELLELLINL